MSLRPLPDFENIETAARLGKLYALREARRDALSQLRDAVTALNSSDESTQREGLSLAREAVDRLEYITKQAA
jgi:phosphate uptake regulator